MFHDLECRAVSLPGHQRAVATMAVTVSVISSTLTRRRFTGTTRGQEWAIAHHLPAGRQRFASVTGRSRHGCLNSTRRTIAAPPPAALTTTKQVGHARDGLSE